MSLLPRNLLQLIGNTPMIELTQFDTGPCRLFLKCEQFNPSGSIKDRTALAMVEAAEREGKIKPGGTLVEATAGNTGLGLAQIALIKGYNLLAVMPDKMSAEKVDHLKALGVTVKMTRSDVSKGDPAYYHDLAEQLAREMKNAYYINQFGNPANPKAHESTTAPEIWEQMNHHLDAIVCGVGTGGHLTGIGRYMKHMAPHVEMVLADPEGSILAHYIKTGQVVKKGQWLVEGIGEDYIPATCDIHLARTAITVSDQNSFTMGRKLLSEAGIFAGSSSGTTVHAAIEYCRQQTKPKRVVTFIYDSGIKYISKMYNDVWMKKNGFLSKTK